MLSKIIRNFVAKRVAGRTDDGIMITLSDPKKVDFQAAMLEDLLMRNGIDPKLIQTENQLKNILNQIKAAEAQATTISGIRGSQSAKVFDLEGKQIPQGSRIMDGKATETEAEIAARLEKQNKDSVQKILDRKNREDVYGLEDYDTTNMSDLKKELIRTETKLGNLNPDSPNFRERAKPLIDKIEAIQKKLREDKADGGRIGLKDGVRLPTLTELLKPDMAPPVKLPDPLERLLKNMTAEERANFELMMKINASRMPKYTPDPDAVPPVPMPTYPREDRADGGRAGFKMGRRAFLKALGAGLTGLGAAKTGIFSGFGKQGTKQVTKEIVKTPPVAGKPEWFDSLVNKVITQGDDISKNFATKERQTVHVKKLNDNEQVQVERDLETGDISVTYESPNNMGEDAVYLQYKAPQKLEEGRTVPADFEATELEPRGVRMGPDDYDIEFDGENVVNSVDELMSDTSTLKQFATNKKPTMKEFVESKNKKDRVQSINKDQVEQAEYLETKYGPAPDEGSPYFQNFDRSEDFASGGIARMLGE